MKESRALRLNRKHSLEELLAMKVDVQTDPANRADAGIFLYTKKASKLLDDIGWAIYWKQEEGGVKASSHTKVLPSRGKNW